MFVWILWLTELLNRLLLISIVLICTLLYFNVITGEQIVYLFTAINHNNNDNDNENHDEDNEEDVEDNENNDDDNRKDNINENITKQNDPVIQTNKDDNGNGDSMVKSSSSFYQQQQPSIDKSLPPSVQLLLSSSIPAIPTLPPPPTIQSSIRSLAPRTPPPLPSLSPPEVSSQPPPPAQPQPQPQSTITILSPIPMKNLVRSRSRSLSRTRTQSISDLDTITEIDKDIESDDSDNSSTLEWRKNRIKSSQSVSDQTSSSDWRQQSRRNSVNETTTISTLSSSSSTPTTPTTINSIDSGSFKWNNNRYDDTTRRSFSPRPRSSNATTKLWQPSFSLILPGSGYNFTKVEHELIDRNNLPNERNSLRVTKHFVNNEGNTFVIIQVSTYTYRCLRDKNFKIKYGAVEVELVEKFYLIQCNRCQRFGHKGYECEFIIHGMLAYRCARCGRNHQTVECKCVQPKCCNCMDNNKKVERFGSSGNSGRKIVDSNHLASDEHCPIRLRALEKVKQNIQY